MPEHTGCILLAEDDRFLRKAVEATLKRHGFTVYTAVDGEEAWRLAQAMLPDLILLDLIMPKLSGFEVLRHLKQEPRTAQIPVVVLSNLGQDNDISQLLQAGAVAYYIKSHIALQDLVTQVEHILHAGEGEHAGVEPPTH